MVLIRTLLMWMLVIAIPAQGMASVTMVSCGPGHRHAGQAAASPQDVQTLHAQQYRADAMQVGHAQANKGVAGSGSDIDHANTHHNVKQKCSVCTTCCVAAVLPSVSVALQDPLLADFFQAHAPSSVSSTLIDGLERPPRTVLV